MNRKIWVFLLAAVFASFALSGVQALDIKSGLMRVVTDELTLRPILYRLVNIAGKSKYEPLFFADDPRTSYIVINIDNRIYRLGNSQEYRVTQKRIDNGIEITYQSVVNRVTYRLVLAAFGDSRIANGFKSEIVVENLSQRDMKVMIKQVFDTWLGEKLGRHFSLPDMPAIAEERMFDSGSKPAYVMSPGEVVSVALLLEEESIPDLVLLANWKRMSDSRFFYESNLMKGFSMIPYSVNDSAVSLFWNERIVPAGGTIKVGSSWLAGGSGDEFASWLAQHYPFSSRQGASQPTLSANTRPLTLDVEDLMAMVARIDQAIAEVDKLSDEDLAALLKDVELLEAGETGGALANP